MRHVHLVALVVAALAVGGCKSKEAEAKDKLEHNELIAKAEAQASIAVANAEDKASTDKALEAIKTLEDLDPKNAKAASMRKKLLEVSNGCDSLTDAVESCAGRIHTAAGKRVTWKVTKDGTYSVTVTATGKDKFLKLWPKVTLRADGKDVAEEESDEGAPVTLTKPVAAGTYELVVNDVAATHVEKLKGGAGFTLSIRAK